MHSWHVSEIGGLAGAEPASVKELHGHGHACLALELAFGNVQGTEERFGVGDAERFHGRSLWHQKGAGKVEIGTLHLWWASGVAKGQMNDASADVFRLMLLSRARVDVSQTHRFPKLLQVPRQMLGVRALLVFEPEDKATLRFFRRVFLNLLNRCIPRRLAILVLLDVPG